MAEISWWREAQGEGAPLRLSRDIPVFFRAPPMGACLFLLRRQEKEAKEKATPVQRFSSIRGRKIRSVRPGLPTRHPWRDGKWAQSVAPTLRA